MTPIAIASGPARAAVAIGVVSRGKIKKVNFRIPTASLRDAICKLGCILSL